MPSSAKRTFDLSDEQAAYIDAKVASGAFASDSDVISAGVTALRAREETIEAWLRDEVAPSFDRWKSDPSGELSSSEVAERMQRRHAARLKAGSWNGGKSCTPRRLRGT